MRKIKRIKSRDCYKISVIKGRNIWNWQGGDTEFSQKIRNLLEYKYWRKQIFQRDNFTCQICGKRGTRINAHHINAFKNIIRTNKIKTIEDAIKCKELWDINWGVVLCEKCHSIFKSHIIWISGNSGSGKTTLGKQLQRLIKYSILLDGDVMRRSISIELGFSEKDRNEHNLRVARLAKVLAQQGHMIIVTLICPYRKLREEVKKITNCKFIYLKGGKSGPEYPYEPPINPEILLENGKIEWPDKK